MDAELEKNYDKKLKEELRYRESQSVPFPNNLKIIKELIAVGNKAYEQKTLEGYLAAILLFQQVIEDFLLFLIEQERLYVRTEIWPSRFVYKPINKKATLGMLIDELSYGLVSKDKVNLVNRCKDFNLLRVKVVHRLTSLNTLRTIQKEVEKVKSVYDEIEKLCFACLQQVHYYQEDLRRNVDIRNMIDEM